MAGYDYGAGMSNNAVAAYDGGLVPASKVRGVPSKLVSGFCGPEEWHHSSKFYNAVDFYDPEDVRATFGLGCNCEPDDCRHFVDPAAVAALAAYKAERTKAAATLYFENCSIRWTEFERSRKRWIPIERTIRSATVRQKGTRIDILLSNGATITKLTSGKNLAFVPGPAISALAWTRRVNKAIRNTAAKRVAAQAAAVAQREADRLAEEAASASRAAERSEKRDRARRNLAANKLAPDTIAKLAGTIFDPATPFEGVENAGYVRMRRCQFLIAQNERPTIDDFARAAGVAVSDLRRARPDGFPRDIYSLVTAA